MLLSVIIPVYNLKGYLKGCLESVTSQGLPEDSYEIICIDDGSSDGSLQELESLSSIINNLRIIGKENGGVSSARNVGMYSARGKYILFLDADDNLGPSSLKVLLNMAEESDADLFIARSTIGGNGKEKYPWSRSFSPNISYTPQQILSKGYFRGSACGCLFNRGQLSRNKLEFDEDLAVSEDTIFMSSCLSCLKSVQFIDINLYEISERSGSASRTVSREQLPKYGRALDVIEKLSGKKPPYQPILHYAKYQIIIRIAVLANKLQFGAGETARETGLSNHLPIKMEGIKVDRIKIGILNRSFTLFKAMIKLRDSLK